MWFNVYQFQNGSKQNNKKQNRKTKHMARPINENNTYKLVCKVTGNKVPTNPKQFRAVAARYNVTDAELKDSYVSRAGRKILAGEKLTADEAVAKYGLHPNVASNLKAVVKPAPVKVETPAVEAVVETPAEVPATEAVAETAVEVVAESPVTEEAVTVEA